MVTPSNHPDNHDTTSLVEPASDVLQIPGGITFHQMRSDLVRVQTTNILGLSREQSASWTVSKEEQKALFLFLVHANPDFLDHLPQQKA